MAQSDSSPSSSSSSTTKVQKPYEVISAVSFYIVTSITMVLANKWVLASLPDLPLLFLWLQLVVAVLLLTLSHQLGWVRLSHSTSRFPALQGSKCRQLWQMVAVNVVGLASNTLCLKYIDASLYQVARSLILPFTIVLQYVFLKSSSSSSVLLSCGVVTLGFIIGLFGDDQSTREQAGVTPIGVFFGVFSSMTTAFHAIVIKKSLEVVQGDTLVLAWYNNVLSALGLFPLVMISGEFQLLRSSMDVSNSTSAATPFSTLVWGTLVTGLFGFLINIAGFFQIKVTSPVSHMISSAVRGVLQTFLAVWVFHEVLTSSRVLGIVFILGGSCAYTYFKSQGPRYTEVPSGGLPEREGEKRMSPK